MEKLNRETADIMAERFGKDSIIVLATTEGGVLLSHGKRYDIDFTG